MSDPPKKDDGNESGYEIEGEIHDVEERPIEDRKPIHPSEVLGGKMKQKVSVASPETKRRFKARLFSLKNNRTKKANINLAGHANRSYDYEELYEEDEYGKEAFPEARVWKVYNDETGIFDQERIDAWRDALDVLLVFIGLFSAIVTTFVVQTSQALQPDYAQMMVIVGLEILRTVQNSTITNDFSSSSVTDIAFGQATPSYTDKVVNGLWFTSLAVSLSTALLTVLTKQWLYHYTTSTSGTSRERARIRQFRFGGLEAYRVPLIIDLLPILLHLALALFLVGLTIFLSRLHQGIAGIVGGIMGVSYILYVITIYLPIRDPRCPYKSPLSFYAYWLYHGFARRPKRIIAHHISTLIITPANALLTMGTAFYLRITRSTSLALRAAQSYIHSKTSRPTPPSFVSLCSLVTRHTSRASKCVRQWAKEKDTPPTLSIAETEKVQHAGNQLAVDAVVYLYNTSSNSTVRTITLEAFCGLGASDANFEPIYNILDKNLSAMVRQYATFDVDAYIPTLPANMVRKVGRLLRALCTGDRERLNHTLETTFLFEDWLQYPWKDWDVFRSRLFPILFPSLIVFVQPRLPAQNFLSAPFAECLKYELPIPVWAQVIRAAIRSQPTDYVIRSILLGFLHELSLDKVEMGAVTLKTAMQNLSIRRLAIDYLGISDGDVNNLPLIFLSSFHDLLSREELTPDSPTPCPSWRVSSQSDVFSLLFDSLSHYTRWKWISATEQVPDVSGERQRLIRSIFQLAFEPSNLPIIPWKGFLAAMRALNMGKQNSGPWIAGVVTPSWIRNVLQWFRPIPPPDDVLHHWPVTDRVSRDQDLIKAVVEEVSKTLWAVGHDFAMAREIVCNIHELGMLPHITETPISPSNVSLFWAPDMVRMLPWLVFSASKAEQLPGLEEEWFEEMLSLIHAPEQLKNLCLQLLLANGLRHDFLDDLCRIQPGYEGWLTTFESLLLLFDDQAYLTSYLPILDEELSAGKRKRNNPRQHLANRLKNVKEILQEYHPVLRQSKYDVPQFDDDDNLIVAPAAKQHSNETSEHTPSRPSTHSAPGSSSQEPSSAPTEPVSDRASFSPVDEGVSNSADDEIPFHLPDDMDSPLFHSDPEPQSQVRHTVVDMRSQPSAPPLFPEGTTMDLNQRTESSAEHGDGLGRAG